MMKNLKKIARVLSLVAAVFMVLMLVTQILPFWSFGEDEVSIANYLWHPDHHKDITNFFKDFFKTNYGGAKFSMNYIYLTPLAILGSCVFGIILSITKRGRGISFILPAFGGIYGAMGYLQNYLFQMGQNWQLHMIVCLVTGIVGCAGLIISGIRFFQPIEK